LDRPRLGLGSIRLTGGIGGKRYGDAYQGLRGFLYLICNSFFVPQPKQAF
jgi:hypothetical protein